MRVVDSHQDAQQRRCRGQRQCQGCQARPQHGQPYRESGGQGGMVAREGPVPRRRALGDRLDPSQRSAGPLLVHDQFQSLADRIGGNGADTDHDGSCRAGRVLAADRGPAQPGQQQSEDHQGALGGHLEKRACPSRCVRNCSGHRPVRRYRSPFRDLRRVGLAQTARGQPNGRPGSRSQQCHGAQQPGDPGVLFRVRFHGHERRRGSSRRTEPNGKAGLGRWSGLTPARSPATPGPVRDSPQCVNSTPGRTTPGAVGGGRATPGPAGFVRRHLNRERVRHPNCPGR
ncbi:hypothetical protein SAMN02745898_101320 [Streptomyces sp. 136MFCol5.1]|nr:hypothetical protein SAMN02745898_101320 [Streptomyces sp. 136MFCol5.1]